MSEEKENQGESALEEIFKSGSVTAGVGSSAIHCLSIIGQIEGHYALGDGQKATKYEHLLPLLVSIEENEDVKGLLVVLNTMGGDVEAGLALAELIASMKKPTVSLVLGGGHSIGVPLAVAAQRSFIVPSATMTLHPVRISGVVIGAPQTYRYFQKMQDRIIRFTVENSHITDERYRELVLNTGELVTDIGTILEGKEAVDCGLIDAVGTLCDATDALYKMIETSEQ